ncbi:MAG: bifunctional DNA primase/polymerase [Desulfovibrio sp.]|nr:bifunctional DNA primase/polymerase [Desulfovibrio sp.]
MSTSEFVQEKVSKVNYNEPFKGKSLADTALELADNWGFSIFPLLSQTKKPDVNEWTPFQLEAPSIDAIENWWENKPNNNIAIVCGKVSDLVVVDCDRQSAVDWVATNFICTPLAVKTHRGFHYYYKYPHGSEEWLKMERERHKRLKDGIDIQIDGFYVVGPNSIHPNGDTYTMYEQIAGAWENEYVPVLQMAVDPIEKEGGIDLSETKDLFSSIGHGSRHDKVLSYVGALIAKGLPYAEVLQRARQMVQDRCEECKEDPFTDKEIVSIVRSTFKSHERNHPHTASTVNGGEDLATNMSNVRMVEILDENANDWPEEILHPGGLLEEIADYTEKSSVRTERIFAVGGAISLIGAVASQRFCNTSELTTNMYVLLIGKSSSGKDAPRKAINRLILEASNGMTNLYAGSDVSSDTSILTYLKRDNCHRALFIIDEIGLFFKNTKNVNSPKCGVIKTLTELFTKGNDGHIKRYANVEHDIHIPWLSLSILGMSVPSEFWPSMNSGETTNGFLGRCLVLESKSDYKESRNEEDVNTKIPEELLQKIQKIWDIDVGDNKPSNDNKHVDLVIKPKPFTIEYTEEAIKYKNDMKKKVEHLQRKAIENSNDAAGSIYGRNNEYAIKLSIIKYISDNYCRNFDEIRCGKITLDQIKWAWLLVNESTKRTLDSIKDNIHGSEFEANQQKLFKIIKAKAIANSKRGINKPGATLSQLSLEIKELNKRQLQDVIDKCIQANTLRYIPCPPGPQGGRPCMVYAITEEIEG